MRIQEGAWYGPTGPEVGALDTYGDPNTVTLDVGTSQLAQGPSANTCWFRLSSSAVRRRQ
ncbi:trimethylamine-N-oxide reductase TorA [Oligella ureolytica]